MNLKRNILVILWLLILAALAVVLTRLPQGPSPRPSGRDFAYTSPARRAAQDGPVIGHPLPQVIETGFSRVFDLALDPQGRFYVAGDSGLRVFDADGALSYEVHLPEPARALAVGADGQVFVALRRQVIICAGEEVRHRWDALGERVLLSAVALGDGQVFVADSGRRLIWRYDESGRLLGQIAGCDETGEGFVVPSPHLDVLWTDAGGGRLWVTNPGRHRMERYSSAGVLLESWGSFGGRTEDFCGCCNPVSIALTAGGRFVTAEKGIVRVKLYESDGAFIGIVAEPDHFPAPRGFQPYGDGGDVLVVAMVDAETVAVLDPYRCAIRFFALETGDWNLAQ